MKEEDLGKEEERNLFYFGISLPHDLALGKSPRWGIRPSGSDSASTTKFLHPQNSLQGFSIHEVRTSQERLKNADSWDLVPIPTSLTSLPGDWDMVILRPLFDLPMTFKIPSTLKFHDLVILNASRVTKFYFKGLGSYLVTRTSVFSLKMVIFLGNYLCFKVIPL